VLPAANAADFTGSVRVDLPEAPRPLPLGLFGTARVLVGEHEAIVVPDSAVLRDDVSGVARVALVVRNRAHWVVVATGLTEGGKTEILTPPLAVGQLVIVGGLVGLPDGKDVAVAR
jgi:multidrug efflux pump subunit AcrA (membrane-fusion protein)